MNELKFSEKYAIALEVIGIENLIEYFPIKDVEKIKDRIEDQHLNGIDLKLFDKTFNEFRRLRGEFLCEYQGVRYTKAWLLRDLDIVLSKSCWVCLLKRAMVEYYNLNDYLKDRFGRGFY